MTIYYNAQDRKPLVKAISEFTGADAVYMRTPTYAYRIDYFTVTREGNLELMTEPTVRKSRPCLSSFRSEDLLPTQTAQSQQKR